MALLFLAPSLIGFSLFYLIPFTVGIFESMSDRALGGSFVGLDNYREVLGSTSFLKAASNMALFTFISVPLLIALSLAVALLLNRAVFFRNWLRTAFVLPLVVPVASVVMVWQIFFDWNGTLNQWLHHFGADRIDWLQSNWSPSIVALMYIWKNIGYNMILFPGGSPDDPQGLL